MVPFGTARNERVNIKDVIIVSMYDAMRCNVGISGKHFPNPAELEQYSNHVAYDVAEETELFEWAVPSDLRTRFDRCSTPQNFRVLISSYEVNPETSM